MNTSQIDSFIATAQEGSINRAAELRFISQPTLKKQLDSLETELGVSLFFRTPQGCTLTKAGSFFFERAIELRNQFLAAVEQTRALGNEGVTAKIGVLAALETPTLTRSAELP